MNIIDLIELYKKERLYEQTVFGNYKNDKNLNIASFLVFLKHYIDKAIESYTNKWSNELPEWLLTCREYEINKRAPIKTYENIIKIMALSGAILESFSDIDPEKWREKLLINSKWLE